MQNRQWFKVYKEDKARYQIIGYVGSGFHLSSIDASLMTHINYAFARIDESCNLYFVSENGPDELKDLVSLKKDNPSLKILVSIGGVGGRLFFRCSTYDSSRAYLPVE